MNALGTLIYKEIIQLIRNKGLLIFIAYAFTLDIYLASIGIDLSLKNAKFFVEDLDMSKSSRELISKFQAPTFNFQGYITNEGEIENILLKDKAIGIIRIPDGFEKDLPLGESKVAVIVNGAEIAANYLFAGYSERIINAFAFEKTADKYNQNEGVKGEEILLFNSNGESKYFMGISELLTVITMFLIVLPASAIIREKEKGNIEMIIVSPTPNYVFLLAKIISMALITITATFISLMLVIKPVLNIPIKGSILDLLLLTTIYVFTTSGISMAIASVSKNMLQVSQLSILILMPILYLSGSWTPIESMPEIIQHISTLSPLKYYINGAFGVVFKGLGIHELWKYMIVLLSMGIAISLTGGYYLSKRI